MKRIIPLVSAYPRPDILPFNHLPSMPLADRLGRPLRDLRISVTDRCNFRCRYCMPKEIFNNEYQYLKKNELLSFEEISRVARIAVSLGVEKIRLTGGEPLLRKNLPALIHSLAQLSRPCGQLIDLTMTTNGSLLTQYAPALVDAGLKRLTISLDALDDNIFQQMNDADVRVDQVLHGLEAAVSAGFKSVKINMVVRRGLNERQIVPMARYFKGSGHILRFIEYMDVGNTNAWRREEVVPSSAVLAILQQEFGLSALQPQYPGEVAERWSYNDGSGEIGFISSVTQAFCRDCTRARLSTDGKLYLCLFAGSGHDLRYWLRQGNDDQTLTQKMASIWQQRQDRYSELRAQENPASEKVEMSFIGG
jgi:cyclic pyranopterin phosphate synthase